MIFFVQLKFSDLKTILVFPLIFYEYYSAQSHVNMILTLSS